MSVGVPIVPGLEPADQSPGGLRAAVEAVGFPALLKPSAGGGGKGIRMVREPGEVAAAITIARREAAAAFGDDTIYVERHLQRPRHVEIQIAADRQGNLVHLFERECSIQRRYQMELTLRAPTDGIIDTVTCREGELAKPGVPLVTMQAPPARRV